MEEDVLVAAAFLLQRGQVLLQVFGRGPGVGEPLGVVVLEHSALLLRDEIEIIDEIGEAPGQDEGQGDFAEGADLGHDAKRAHVGALVGRRRFFVQVLEPAVGPEIVPEDLQVVPPVAAHPVREIGDILPRRGQDQRAEGRRVGLDPGRGHG